MILRDGTELEIDCAWEMNAPVIINIIQSKESSKRWSEGFVGIDLTEEQAIEMCKKIMDCVYGYNDLEKSSLRYFLEEANAKSNTDEQKTIA